MTHIIPAPSRLDPKFWLCPFVTELPARTISPDQGQAASAPPYSSPEEMEIHLKVSFELADHSYTSCLRGTCAASRVAGLG